LLHSSSFLGLYHLYAKAFAPSPESPGLRPPRRVSSTPLRSEPASSTPPSPSPISLVSLLHRERRYGRWPAQRRALPARRALRRRAVARPSPPDEPLTMLLLLPPSTAPIAPASCYGSVPDDSLPSPSRPAANPSSGHPRPARLHHPSSSLGTGRSSNPPATLSATLISENRTFPAQPTRTHFTPPSRLASQSDFTREV
jgi:hypothetical protein